jgi:hypothetical protein
MPTEEPLAPTGQEARWGPTACLDAVDTEEYALCRESKSTFRSSSPYRNFLIKLSRLPSFVVHAEVPKGRTQTEGV